MQQRICVTILQQFARHLVVSNSRWPVRSTDGQENRTLVDASDLVRHPSRNGKQAPGRQRNRSVGHLEFHVAADSLHGECPVSVVLVHVPPGLEGNQHHANPGLLNDRLGGVVCRLVRVTGPQRIQFGRQVDLDQRVSDVMSLRSRRLIGVRSHGCISFVETVMFLSKDQCS
jgi:hypothetical protein